MELTPAEFCRGKIDRSAEALRVRHHPSLFPSEINFAGTPREQLRGERSKEWHLTCHCERRGRGAIVLKIGDGLVAMTTIYFRRIPMCGIVGYIGPRDATPIILSGLKRLEYRGYDSAGLAIVNGEQLEVRKDAGKLSQLIDLVGKSPINGAPGIGHTRWATHG